MTRAHVVLAAVGAWALVADTGWVSHRALAGPVAIIRALAGGLRDGTLVADAGATLARALAGVLAGSAVGIVLGALSSRRLEPSLDFLRSIPPLLVLPLLCLALGYGEPARVLVIAWAAALVISLHVGATVARGDGSRVRALRAMGASRLEILRWVRAPELVQPTLVALRQAVATALVVAVVSEMVIGAENGLGARAVAAQIAYDAPGLWAVMIAAGAIGWTASRGLLAVEARLAHFRG